ncbi:MAG TPA: N-acetylmuramoyl-L-alanine amidase, partial [Prevotella sp.]|nr:N-acetylmuramoyl-L-alanine amidase [Prevotella sp.]
MSRRSLLTLGFLLLCSLTLCAASRQFTVVIDAGHGGNDCGAKGLISYEKNLTLRYALALGSAIEKNFDDVRVVYTRRTDVFIPLHERADIANRNKADLFLSVHINALAGGRISHGFQSYTLGTGERTGSKGLQENLEVAKRENSVIFLEKDYKTRYKGLENSAEGDIMFELIADKNRERSVELSRILQTEVCRATGRVNGGAHQNNLAVLRLT